MICYTEQDLVSVAGRENNKKRTYLVVNRLQGKHVPVSPHKALQMFDALGALLEKEYKEEKLLLIGFAETATAVGAAAAGRLHAWYLQTTREQIEGVEYFYFSEQHSHAAEQKLVKDDLDQVLPFVDRIIFVEDEITTGKTIWNIIQLLKKTYPDCPPFSAVSILNGMDADCQNIYKERKIGLHWLVKTQHETYPDQVSGLEGDGVCHVCSTEKPSRMPEEYGIGGLENARRLTKGAEYRMACQQMAEKALQALPAGRGSRILVVGTEEFMYPALILGELLEQAGTEVRCHSTTRSPIVVSKRAGYPLRERYQLSSLYDAQRRTFIYDLAAYEEVLIVTDASGEKEGLYSLVNALHEQGNDKIYVIRWCEA